MSTLPWGEPSAPAAAREESIPLPRPEEGRTENALMAALCLTSAVAVFQFFSGLASFAERAPALADGIDGFRPEFVHHLFAVTPTNHAPPVVLAPSPATSTADPSA
ncbi:MAG: hypothetical protein JNK85_21545 [Verrucomicrobiales bacterium]|nr:hypothetical protein [Verrucomicrobiales bacterium]